MLNVPFLARGLAVALIVLGLYLAGENTMISADVLSMESGASAIASVAIAVTATGLELTFASWIRQGDSTVSLWRSIRSDLVPSLVRLFFIGIGLGLVYHFDILTTAKHPRLITDSGYFFAVVVAAFVFGPEICIVVSAWLWRKAIDIETSLMAESNHKDAENAFRRSERDTLVSLAHQAGREKAVRRASERWGPNS